MPVAKADRIAAIYLPGGQPPVAGETFILRIAPPARDALTALGHEIKEWPDFSCLAGSVEVIRTGPGSRLTAAGPSGGILAHC